MRKALVFVVAFTLVLVAGAAFAFMSTPGNEAADEKPLALEEPTTTSSTFHEKEAPPTTEELKDEEHEEEPPKEEDVKDEVGTKDTDPPDLVILHPENEQHFETSKIAFEGKTEPGARVFAGDYEADVDDEGNWRIVLILNEGGNLARFTASDEAGNKSTAEVKAFYDAPKDEKPADYEFTAHQKYGSCSEDVPYDKWYGTGTPGQQIWIGSDYGSGTTTVGEDGNWDIKVEFPEASCGDEIAVVLETDGFRKVYEFIRYCEEEGGEGEDK